MEFWRICKKRHASSAFSGMGAERAGGRWNYKGYPIVYASENLSLATLELFVHTVPGVIPPDMVAIRGRFPASVSTMEVNAGSLPTNWRSYPAPDALKDIGSTWIEEATSLVLVVPSAINDQEKNFLVNPHHDEMVQLEIVQTIPFQFDPRMFGK